MTDRNDERRSSHPLWPRLLIGAELLLLVFLLLRKDRDPVPSLAELERVTGTLEDVATRCATDSIGGGPATLTLCGVNVTLGSSMGSVVHPYGNLSAAAAGYRQDALLTLRGQTVDLWLRRPNANPEAPPVIWRLNYNGQTVIPYTDVAEYNATFDREFAHAFGIPACLFCLVETIMAVRSRRILFAAWDGRFPASFRWMEGGFDGVMLIGLSFAAYYALIRENGTSSVIVLLCAMVGVLGWFLRNDGELLLRRPSV